MQEKQQRTRFGAFLTKAGKRLANLGPGLNFMDKNTVSRIISNAKENKIAETVKSVQESILGEIRFRLHQPIGAITDFEKNNLIVSLTENEQKHSEEIFKPFIEKGYAVTPLSDYEPFEGYNVYIVSWK